MATDWLHTAKRITQCYVSQKDYAKHWDGSPIEADIVRVYEGPDRREGGERRVGHDRRWEAASGRRYRLADRRRG